MVGTDPKYSIIITAHNRREYIQAAFQSAVLQDYTGSYEIIIVSNFVDKHIKAESLKNPSFVKYILDESEPLGQKQANGILAARGEWICLLEDDDLFCKNKLFELDSIIHVMKNAGIIKNPVSLINANGDEILYPNSKTLLYCLLDPMGWFSEVKRKEYQQFYKILPAQNDYFNLYAIFSGNSSLTIKKDILLNYLQTLKGIKLSSESLFLSLSLIERKDKIITKKILGKYRIHSNNSSNANNIDPFVSLNVLKNFVHDFKLTSSLPIQSRYRNALKTISSRFQILYIYRMHINGEFTFKQIVNFGFITALFYGIFGRPEKRIFILPFRGEEY